MVEFVLLFDQRLLDLFDTSVVESPLQKEVSPTTEIIGLAGEDRRTVFTSFDLELQPELLV